jgi:hypothetical protein
MCVCVCLFPLSVLFLLLFSCLVPACNCPHVFLRHFSKLLLLRYSHAASQIPDVKVFHITEQHTHFYQRCLFFQNIQVGLLYACKHAQSITHRSNQMHYFYYLKFKTIYNLSLWYTTNCLQFFKNYPTCFGACFAPSSGVSCLVGLLLGMLCSCCSVVLFVSPYPTVVIHCWCPACVLSCIYPASMVAETTQYSNHRRYHLQGVQYHRVQ